MGDRSDVILQSQVELQITWTFKWIMEGIT